MVRQSGDPHPRVADICAIIVTFHPGAGLAQLLASIAQQVAQIVIVDNHSPAPALAFVRAEASRYGCRLIENEANAGIARALNLGVRYAAAYYGAQWVVIFDQDTQPDDDQVRKLLALLQAYPTPNALAVIGSNYIKLPLGDIAYAPTAANDEPWMRRDFAITSGALVSLSSFMATGGFRDEFFIDCVDFDYSFRARVAGFETVVSRTALMAHTVGAPLTRRVGRLQLVSSNHRAERRYYRVRNVIVLLKEYLWTHPRWVIPRFLSMLKSVLMMSLLEAQRPRKLRYVLRGLWDGMRADFRYSPLADADTRQPVATPAQARPR